MRPAFALALQTQTVRWERPPAGTLQRGVLGVNHASLVAALVVAALVALLAASLYRRFRRRSKSP